MHLDSVDVTNTFFFPSALTLAEAKRQFAKHFRLIFKVPWRFKKKLIYMFLIHLHSTHKKSSWIWSHCGPGALKSFQMSLLSIEIQMLCFVSSKQIWNWKKKVLVINEKTQMVLELREKKNPQIIEALLKYEELSFFKDFIQQVNDMMLN